MVGPFDEVGLVYPWRHNDPRVDQLQADIQTLVQAATARGEGRREIFSQVWMLAEQSPAGSTRLLAQPTQWAQRAPVPYLTEPWYC